MIPLTPPLFFHFTLPLIGDYFDIRGYAANNTFQLICAPNVCSVKGPNKKKIGDFIINAVNSVGIAIDTLSPNVKVITY